MICATPYAEAVFLHEDDLSLNELTGIWKREFPTNLYQIGGLDWTGWASLCAVSSDDSSIISGVYLDKLISYSGYFSSPFAYEVKDWMEVFSLYSMSHFDFNSNSLVLYHKKEGWVNTLSFQVVDAKNIETLSSI